MKISKESFVPHGDAGGVMFVATPIALYFFFPSVYNSPLNVSIRPRRSANLKLEPTIAFTRATLSAQMVTGYEAFSMLAPMTHEPSSQSRAQPTWKFEYGPRFGRTHINMTSEKAAVKLNHCSSSSTKDTYSMRRL